MLLAVIVLTVVVFKAVQPMPSKEPEYQGRKLSDWVDILGDGKSKEQKAQAVEALREMGTNALPILVDKICAATPRWKQEISVFAWNHGFDPFGNFGGEPEQINAFGAIVQLKQDAYPAIPLLVQRLETVNEPSYIFMVLEGMGRAAVPELAKALTSKSPALKEQAMSALALIDPQAEDALPELTELLKDKRYVASAAKVIRRISPTKANDLGIP